MGTVPESWKNSSVVPILKRSKSPDSVINFKPIFLTSIIAKLKKRMVNVRLNWYWENFELMCQEPAGCRRNHSTANKVVYFSHALKNALDISKVLAAIFVDFKLAYDSVFRKLLIQKLSALAVKSDMLRWF